MREGEIAWPRNAENPISKDLNFEKNFGGICPRPSSDLFFFLLLSFLFSWTQYLIVLII